MENDGKIMTTEESLSIITEMVNKTRFDLRRGIFYLLFWGWLIFFCALGDFLLLRFTSFEKHYLLWLLTFPGVLVSIAYGWRTGLKTLVKSYTANIYMWTWYGFLISWIILMIVHSGNMDTISPHILILVGFATFISGFIIRFTPLVIGGLCFWIFALAISFAGPGFGSLGTALAMLSGYLIPGYIMKYRIDNGKI
jgi:hypothetical protein